uniref:Mpv17-like protein n=1 Tax=Vombatus ursinus TaxID=29139 RepID=A0A4X2KHS4_VOMUR
MSILQKKEDKFLDLRQKFWNTYKTGLLYWPFVQVSFKPTICVNFLVQFIQNTNNKLFFFLPQLTNFSFVPIYFRTAYTGLCGFVWATFLCYSQQSGDGTVSSVFAWLKKKEAIEVERSPEK